MYPFYDRSNDDALRSPRGRTSTSTLFAAFRNLTGANGRPAASSPSTSTTFDSPAHGASAGQPGADGVVDVPSLSLNGPAIRPLTPTSGVSGGPPHLQDLLEKLRRGNDVSARNKAAKEVASLLKTYPVDNVMGIWTIARDMVEDDETPELHTAGYSLLYACVKYKKLTPHERGFFFEAIPPQDNPSTFHLRFRVLQALTADARYLDSLEDAIIPLMVRLLKQSWKEAITARQKKSNKQDKGGDVATKLSLKQIFDFIADVIKFNSKLCPREDFRLLIDELLSICRKTSEPTDLDRCIEIIDSIIVYAQLDSQYLQAYAEILCGTYSQVKDLRSRAWKNITNLLQSHHGPATHTCLLSTLKHARAETYAATRGTLAVYRRIIDSPESQPLPQTSIAKLVSACRKALGAHEVHVDHDVLLLLRQLVRSSDTTSLILDEKRWTDFADTLESCATRYPSPRRTVSFSKPPGSIRGKGHPADDTKSLEAISQALQNIVDTLMEKTVDLDMEQKSQIMTLLMRLVPQLNDSTATELVVYFAEERLQSPSSDEWRSGCDQLLKAVFFDKHRSANVRKLALRTLFDAYNTAEALGGVDVDNLIGNIFSRMTEEREVAIMGDMAGMCATIAAWTTKEVLFDEMILCLQKGLSTTPHSHEGRRQSESSIAKIIDPLSGLPESTSTHIANALVRVFLRCVSRSAWKTEKIFAVLLAVTSSEHTPVDARIICLKLLFRLRADIKHGVFVIPDMECESLAATVCRTSETAAPHTTQSDSPVLRPSNPDEHVARRPNPTTINSTPAVTRAASTVKRTSASAGPTKLNRPPSPLWMYPDPQGLPEEPARRASHLVFVCLPSQEEMEATKTAICKLDVGAWLEMLIKVLQQQELEWEIFSYIVVHLGAQLSNHALFKNAVLQIQLLRSVVCGQLSNKSFHEPPSWTGLSRSDVAVCLFYILTMLLGYRDHFSKNEADDMVKMFTLGMGSYERTADMCIHALSVCCHELPLSITKSMGDILQRMSQIITRGSAAVHVLEFLAGLARMPELYRNFREDEFKLVFGICFRYLQFIRDQHKTQDGSIGRGSNSQLRLSTLSRENHAPTERQKQTPVLADELPQYVFALVYHVMTFWFISLKLSDRPKQVSWIKKQLMYTDAHDRQVLDEQSQVLVDMMERVSYSDRDETAPDQNFATEPDGPVISKSWLVGTSILTIETAGRTGVSQMTSRRPSSTRYSILRPRIVGAARHQVPIYVGLEAENVNDKDYVGIHPDDILQEFYSPQSIGDIPLAEPPIALPDDDMTRRGISTFDRISPLDGHKCGIIFIGDGQHTEQDILQNVMGSDDYTVFLSKIGTYIKLKGAKLNTQGLDRENDFDGAFTIAWRDRVTELVFHVTTLMPTDVEHDPQCINKKRHIGNDHVNIIFNNSGDSFRFDTFPSDFGWVYIVITPEARASFVETRLAAADHAASSDASDSPWDDTFYKVTTLVKPGMPQISPAAETKIISGASLASFVRLIALNASVFCQVWQNKTSLGGSGEHVSSWRNRLREIKRLRDRHAPEPIRAFSPVIPARQGMGDRTSSSSALAHLSTASMGPPALNYTSAAPTPSSARDSTRESALFRRASQANIFSLSGTFSGTPGDVAAHRHSAFSGSADMERSSSAGSAH